LLGPEIFRPLSYFYFPFRNSPLGLFNIEASRLHSDTPRSVGLLWTCDQLVTETNICQNTTVTKICMFPAVFETIIPEKERPQTQVLGRAETGIGHPLDLWSARHRDQYLSKYNGHKYIRVSSGIRNRNSKKREAVDPGLKSRRHGNRPVLWLFSGTFIFNVSLYSVLISYSEGRLIYVRPVNKQNIIYGSA
jgi:hypothetical protein